MPPGAASAQGRRESRRLPQRGRVGAGPAAEEGEARSFFGGVEAELGQGEGGVEGVEDALGVVDMAAGCCCDGHGSRLAARGGRGDGEMAVQGRMGMMGSVEVLAMAEAHKHTEHRSRGEDDDLPLPSCFCIIRI